MFAMGRELHRQSSDLPGEHAAQPIMGSVDVLPPEQVTRDAIALATPAGQQHDALSRKLVDPVREPLPDRHVGTLPR
jgi:hypothetical protein